jgi:hypothetical protein
VELASAIVVVSGVVSLLGALGSLLGGATDVPAELPLLSWALGLGLVVLGVLVRYGHAWLVAVNVLAILGFIELTSASVPGVLLGGIDVFVVLALFRERPWFQQPKVSP